MKLLAYRDDGGQSRVGAVSAAGELVELGDAGDTLDTLLRQGAEGLAWARQAAARSHNRRTLEGLRYLPPLSNPGKAICVGLNYHEHALESGHAATEAPTIFTRYSSSWVAHEEPLVRPAASICFDYEAELVAVIGRRARHVAREAALDHIFGYSIFNDGSVRDYQSQTSQWTAGKNFDLSGAFGPVIVTADELPPGARGLSLKCRVNDQVVQAANTSQMIHDVAALVVYCSSIMTLDPGDIIVTGTPSGVGAARNPPLWLKPGDFCEVEIEGVGTLRNPVVVEVMPMS